MTQTRTAAPMLTSVTEVRNAVQRVADEALNARYALATHLERELTAGVLEAIASGNAQAGYLAAEALKARDIKFPRTTT